MGQEAPQMGWATLQVDRKALPEGRLWSGCPSGGPRVVGRLSQLYGSGPEAIAEARSG